MVTLKRWYRLRDGHQIPVRSASVHWIMSQPTFALGVADARASRRYHRDYDLWNTNGQWNYERGRMWAALAPPDVQLKLHRRINPRAVAFYRSDII